jgi:hypothetical protein
MATKRALFVYVCVLSLLALAVWEPGTHAFERYQDGCNAAGCHGDFTGPATTKVPPSVFPGDDKHRMHRNNSNMATECDLCHTSNDNNNPFIGSSDGTANNPGRGCIGCHNARGLRAHHPPAVVDCYANGNCHASPVPPPESNNPTYYGTVDTLADDSCNSVQQAETGENWTIGDFIGLDNDGDGLYDGDDPDCATAAQTPGASSSLLVSAHTPGTGEITITYGPACEATDNNIEWGLISQLGTAAPYSGQTCSIANTGTAVWTYPAGEVFFLVVGNNAVVEGSYGLDSAGVERLEDTTSTTCPVPQDLVDRCD